MTTAADTLTSGNNGAGASTGTQAPGSTAAGGLPATPPSGWWDTVKDNDVKGWLAGKKYPDAESALKAHWGLERLFGADKAGRAVVLPKDDNDSAGWAELNKRLGVPENADGYKLPMPEGSDPEFSKAAASAFQKAGITPRQANGITEWWNGWVAEQVKNGETADRARSEQELQALQKEWGKDYDAKAELGRRGYREFAKQFGIDDGSVAKIEAAIGTANLMKFFTGLGSLAGEDSFAGGTKPGGFGMSVADAQKRVNEITANRTAGKYSDLEWRKDIMPEMDKLGRIIASAAS